MSGFVAILANAVWVRRSSSPASPRAWPPLPEISSMAEASISSGVPPPEDDVALVRAARTGDRFAFGQLYQRFAPMVHGVLLARVRPEAGDDLLHDGFV